MNRRDLLTGVGASLVASVAGCFGGQSEDDGGLSGERTSEENGRTTGEDCGGSNKPSYDDSMERFLKEDETPESAGARELLATVEEETDGLTRFTDDNNTGRTGFSEKGNTWELRYLGDPHSGEERFREEIAELSTTFAPNRPDGVSLKATSLHECTTGTWHVCAETAAAYEREELDRKTFVNRVYERAEIVNNC